MKRNEIYELIAKRQDCNVDGLKAPADYDSVSQLINHLVENADTVGELCAEFQHAVHFIQRATTDILYHSEYVDPEEEIG
jgi:hypothetical protein